MPSASRRPARVKRLVRAVLKFQTWREKLEQRRKAQQQQEGNGKSLKSILHRLRSRRNADSSSSEAETASFLQSSGEEDQERLGCELKFRLRRPASLPSLAGVTDDDGDSAVFADDEDSCSDDEMDIDSDSDIPITTSMGWVREEITQMYEHRYEAPRDPIPRMSQSFLHHTLMTLKNGRADMFRQELRVSPYTFDQLVAAIENDPVFQNNSETAHQAPVEEQLAVVLYRFGHDGNGASLQGVANWAGIGKGTVLIYTKRILTALLRPEFMKNAVRLPTEEEKEEAKRWVEDHSCHAWRNGWCFVDGTLVPLYARPYWYGESYFDRKCRYSLNIQVSLQLQQMMHCSPSPTT